MQLNKIITLLLLFGFANSYAQQDSSKVHLEDITINFIASYYEQDGVHSAVTGGIGTEELNNIAPAVIVNIPLDSVKSVSFNGGVDFYSSASSDNINNPFLDPNHVSGASASDSRFYLTAGYKKKNKQKNSERTIYAGFSSEFDVFSLSAGASYSKSSKDNNKSLDLKAMYYFDNWKLIYPVEFRNGTESYLSTNKRHSVIGTITGSFNVNKKLAASISTDIVGQFGLLSTPFHRVYFSDSGNDLPGIELLPNQRIKVPIGLRANYHLTDFLIARVFYRYYWDSWDLDGQTIEITLPVKLNNAIRLYPFFRYHHQNAARYFGTYGTHSIRDEFLTSDFDLATVFSRKYGMGLSIAPLFGLGRFSGSKKEKVTLIKSIDFRYAYYERSDGLNAWVAAFDVLINIQR